MPRVGWRGGGVDAGQAAGRLPPVGCSLLLWSVRSKRWQMLGGASAAVVAMCVVPLAANPAVFFQYVQAMLEHPPTYLVTPTIGTLLRMVGGWTHTWLMYVPALFGVGWLSLYYRRHESEWTWRSQTSLLLFVSVITSPYVWLFDELIFLLPVLQVAAFHSRRASRPTAYALFLFALAVVIGFVVLPWDLIVFEVAPTSTGLFRGVLTTPNMFWHILIAPLFLVAFLVFSRAERSRRWMAPRG